MLKLLLALGCGMVIAVLTLQLRQQQLELNYETNRLHAQIEAQQAKLWSQQMQISLRTAPNAIAQTLAGQISVEMVPEGMQAVKLHWTKPLPLPQEEAASANE